MCVFNMQKYKTSKVLFNAGLYAEYDDSTVYIMID